MLQRTDGVVAGVLGLGLIGASFAARLRKVRPNWKVVGHDPSVAAACSALEKGFVQETYGTEGEILETADFLLLATPIRTILRVLGDLRKCAAGPEKLVLDVGSTKVDIVAAMERLPEPYQAIGGHPMTGRKTAGVEGPSERLFERTRFVLTPTRRTGPDTLAWCRGLIAEFGAECIDMDAPSHDRAVARVSHLPYLLPLAALGIVPDDDDDAHRLIAGGYRAVIRDAGDNASMWADILSTNRVAIADVLDDLATQAQALKSVVHSGTDEELKQLLLESRARAEKRARSRSITLPKKGK